MLYVLERFELESASRGHGAFFPDNQPQLPIHRVSEGLGPSLFLGPAVARSKGVPLLREVERGPWWGWGSRQRPGDWIVTSLPTLPGDPSHTHMQLAGFWGGASLVECALSERLSQ